MILCCDVEKNLFFLGYGLPECISLFSPVFMLWICGPVTAHFISAIVLPVSPRRF